MYSTKTFNQILPMAVWTNADWWVTAEGIKVLPVTPDSVKWKMEKKERKDFQNNQKVKEQAKSKRTKDKRA